MCIWLNVLCNVAAVCVYLVECFEDVGRGMEGINIYGIGTG